MLLPLVGSSRKTEGSQEYPVTPHIETMAQGQNASIVYVRWVI